MAIQDQPISNVEWRHRDDLYANDYNPNHVAPPEFELLRRSILEDHWTLPLIIRQDGEIVDGFHRWTLSGERKIYELTEGYVPCVVLPDSKDKGEQIASTIRYNRARGSHYVKLMAGVVQRLLDEGWEMGRIEQMLGMETEEVVRFIERGNMAKRGSSDSFNPGWIPDVSA